MKYLIAVLLLAALIPLPANAKTIKAKKHKRVINYGEYILTWKQYQQLRKKYTLGKCMVVVPLLETPYVSVERDSSCRLK